MIYNWNIGEWNNLLLPPRKLGKQRLSDMLLAMLEAVQGTYTLFMLFREAMLYRLRWTSQTIWLERLLNDRFNNGNPAFTNFEHRTGPIGIYIDEPSSYINQAYRWNTAEARHDVVRWNAAELSANPSLIRYRHNQSELDANLDFVAKVPMALLDVSNPANATMVANMKAWIEQYRIAWSRYTIVNY